MRRSLTSLVTVVRETGSKPPEAARTVAGGASAASDHRYRYAVQVPTPAGVAECVDAYRNPPRPLPGSESGHHTNPGGRSLALAPPATVRVASGDLASSAP